MLYNIFKCFNNSIYIFVFVVLGLKWSFNKSCWIFFMELFCIILFIILSLDVELMDRVRMLIVFWVLLVCFIYDWRVWLFDSGVLYIWYL